MLPFLLLWELGSSVNILVCVNTPGSHLYFAARAAGVLSAQGHNVTLFSAGNETRVDVATGKNFTYIVHPEMVMYNSSMNEDWDVSYVATFFWNAQWTTYNVCV